MPDARLPSIAVGNGRLLVTSDHNGDILSCCWPCVDSPNQLPCFRIAPTTPQPAINVGVGYLEDVNISFGCTPEGLRFLDAVIDSPACGTSGDVFVRRVCGPHPQLSVHIVPELDGRVGAQTVYWDAESEALLAYCRHNWLAVGSATGRVVDFHCGRRGDESAAQNFMNELSFPGERIAFRSADAILRLRSWENEDGSQVICAFGRTREEVLASLKATRGMVWESIDQLVHERGHKVLSELKIRGWSPDVNNLLRRSSLVFDLLTNRDTGGIIAGPDVQSGIESAPGYAAVWGRDAAWTLIGALSLGHAELARQMLEFAIATQSPEGLWLHRHHTDYSLASSWGLHQIDETGILLFSFDCYLQTSGDVEFVENNWQTIAKAADFLQGIGQRKKFLSVDLWEEREGYHLYTVASTIAGLRATVRMASRIFPSRPANSSGWAATADKLQASAVSDFWNEELGRFLPSQLISSALPMVDNDRPELSAKVQAQDFRPTTALPQYPNWRDSAVEELSFRHDFSVLAMAVPFQILDIHDSRVTRTVEKLRRELWSSQVGGFCRYEGDSYGGGNPWPLATLWLAIFEGASGKIEECKSLVDWVVSHTTPAGLVPEQVHRQNGTPVAAVPLSWSHAMVAIAVAAAQGTNVWKLS